MSKLWEEAIQKWYSDSHTSSLSYLDLAEVQNPTRKELANNIAVIFDRTCLSSRVNLRNFKLLLEKTQKLEEKVQKLEKATKTLSSILIENQPLTKAEVSNLVFKLESERKEIKKLVQNLDSKTQRVETLLSKIEKQIFG